MLDTHIRYSIEHTPFSAVVMTSSNTISSLQTFKDSLLSTGHLGLEDQVEAVQFLEEKWKESRISAGRKCEELKKALNLESENDGEPAEKKPKLEPNNEFYEKNGNKNVNDLRENIKIEEVPEEARSTSDELIVKVKMDLDEAIKTIRTKEAEVEQLKKAVAEKDAEINKTKAEGVTERFRSTSQQLEEEFQKRKMTFFPKRKCDLDDA